MGVFSRPERRIEDARFITGRGRYVEDIYLDGAAVGYVLRSPYAHAKIVRIDVDAAKSAPGVIGILTGADLEAAGIGHLNSPLPQAYLKNRDGTNRVDGDRPILAVSKVSFVGDAVAFIVAKTLDQAKEAGDLITVDYEELPAIASIAEAKSEGAQLVWPDAKGNIAIDWEMGDEAVADAALADAAHVIHLDLLNNRIVVNSLEPRGALSTYDKRTHRYELYATTQGSHNIQERIAGQLLKIPKERLRVVTPDVGGGFGMKIFVYPEYVMTLVAAERFGMPVKWISERGEAFLSDSHGRDLINHVALALDADYRMIGLKIETDFNVGAYCSSYGPFIQTVAPMNVIGGAYKIPVIYNHVRGIFTNTAPVDAYRGAGRPEAAYMIERVVDYAARRIGIPPDELRLRNFIGPQEMPYTTAAGAVLDSGDFPRNLRDCLRNADWDGFAARRIQSQKKGKLRGIGLAYYLEKTAATPGTVDISFEPNGEVKVAVGTSSHGQGHETTFAQIVADRLGVAIESITLIQGDTDRGVEGGGTGGSRSLWASGNGILKTCETVIAKGKQVAAEIMKVASDSVSFDDGAFRVHGSNQFLPFIDVAKAAQDRTTVSEEARPQRTNGLDSRETYDDQRSTYPNGCHIAEVEIDPETGTVTVVNYQVVDDFGFVLNPLIVRGQVHGGVAQGIGQALMENCLYEPGTAQLLSGSFMDYCMPRADDLSPIGFAYNEILCTTNPLGIKGCGEAGTIGACPAIMNAVLDALWDEDVRHVDMPMTPLRVWQKLQEAKTNRFLN